MAYTAIDDPEAHFQTVLYTGDGNNSRTITLPGDTDMQPDMIWLKERSSTSSHYLTSIGMGIGTRLEPDGAGAESTEGLSAVTSDGFTIGTSTNQVNQDTITHVAWCWKESATAGFDIVTWTGNATNRTISHSLSAVPKMIIIKERDGTSGWIVYHTALTAEDDYLILNTTAAQDDSFPNLQATAPTTSVFSVGTAQGTNGNTATYIAYAFAEKQGFSKISSYTGNGDANGTFIYTGLRAAWVMIKESSAAGDDWYIFDNKRDGFNGVLNTSGNRNLRANTTAAETGTDENRIDILSNGFKVRDGGGQINGDGVTYIYTTFAEQPFVNSNGVPANAR